MKWLVAALIGLTTFGCASAKLRTTSDWGAYGRTPGGLRYVPSIEIRPSNVGQLERIWTYSSGDWSDGTGEFRSTSAFEATPILVGGRLVFCTPLNRVIALDPLNGKEFWNFDPQIDRAGYYANQLVCRGVASWTDPQDPDGVCGQRIFTGTNDGRLIALDADSGGKCQAFGNHGEIDLKDEWAGVVDPEHIVGEYQVTSPPLVVGDLVVVGSAVVDNQRVTAPSGVVRAFDVRTGAEQWPLSDEECARRPECPEDTPASWCRDGRLCPKGWDLAPCNFDYKQALKEGRLSGKGYALGTPNVWAVMSADEARGMIFVPTGNPSPDFYRGDRAKFDLTKMDQYGSSVVALEAKTGRRIWRYQTVHHDLWDYDVPAQPVLFELRLDDGTEVPALAQATKTGHVFLLDRVTGRPVGEVYGIERYKVDEKAVPQGGALGETLSRTQPFPRKPPSLAKHGLKPEEAFGFTGLSEWRCRNAIAAMRSEGIFTPPSLEGTVMLPGSVGGLNWSGLAIDQERQILVANANNLAYTVRLFPADQYLKEREGDPDAEVSPQEGTAFGMRRDIFLTPVDIYENLSWLPLPDYLHPTCNPPPWGTLSAVDLETGDIKWTKPLGGRLFGQDIGLPSLGGAIVTETGLVFIAGSIDGFIRAFDIETGEELWREELPAGGQATPMSYEVSLENGESRQLLVIASGGHAKARSELGDKLVAFALPECC